MFATRFLLLISLCVTSSIALPTSRILGGTDVAASSLTYVASVRLDYVHICGGTIISANHIITAAHCLTEQDIPVTATRVSGRVGSTNLFSGGTLVYASAIDIHPDYKDYSNDIAIVTLTTTLVWSTKISSIAFAQSDLDSPLVNTDVLVAGWGEQSSGEAPYKLQSGSFKVAEEDVCTDAYSPNDHSIICLAHALKEGSCTGDAGNGGIYNSKLVALSNFVIGTCGSRYPDIYLNIVHYANWINSVIN